MRNDIDKYNPNIEINNSVKEKLKKSIPGDFLSELKDELKNDALYKIIIDNHQESEIFTQKIVGSLERHMLYSTKDIEEILGLNMSTANNWIRQLGFIYFDVIKRDKYNKFTPIGLLKVRMVQLLKDNSSYSIKDIKKLIIPNVTGPNEEEKPESATEKLNRIDKELGDVKTAMLKINNDQKLLTKLMYKIVDPESIDIENTTNLRLNKTILNNLLESSEENSKEILDKIEKLEKENTDIKESYISKEEIDSIKEELIDKKEFDSIIEETLEAKYAIPSKEEFERLKEQLRPKKGFFEKIFGKRKG